MIGDVIYPTVEMNSVSFDVLIALDLPSLLFPISIKIKLDSFFAISMLLYGESP